MKRQQYVLGFAFTLEGRVALIRKNKPEWQAGKLNGIGGKMEPGEPSVWAMAREFKEETGVEIPPFMWQYRGLMKSNDWTVFVYSVTHEDVITVRTQESEEVELVYLDDVQALTERAIDNVDALIQLCRLPISQPSGVRPTFMLDYTRNIVGEAGGQA